MAAAASGRSQPAELQLGLAIKCPGPIQTLCPKLPLNVYIAPKARHLRPNIPFVFQSTTLISQPTCPTRPLLCHLNKDIKVTPEIQLHLRENRLSSALARACG